MRRASTTTCSEAHRDRRSSSRRSNAFRRGCGATTKCTSSSIGYALTTRASRTQIGFHGLDLYSLFTSIGAVLAYLDDVDPQAAAVARHRYAALTPWQKDPAAYGEAVLVGRYRSSEEAVVQMLRDMLARRLDYATQATASASSTPRKTRASSRTRSATTARCTTAPRVSWNLRDTHMFDTLQSLLAYYGPESKGVVWEHNSHVGDASATEMSARGEHNIGQLCRELFGARAYIVGFGTDHGDVAAASNWDAPMQNIEVRPAHDRAASRSSFTRRGFPRSCSTCATPRGARFATSSTSNDWSAPSA